MILVGDSWTLTNTGTPISGQSIFFGIGPFHTTKTLFRYFSPRSPFRIFIIIFNRLYVTTTTAHEELLV